MNPEAVWYGARHPLALALAPLGGLYCALATLRALAYHRDWLPSHAAGAPTLVVGNLTVGGTGKTPMTLWLADWSRARGWRPGIVTRAHGGRVGKGPQLVPPGAEARQFGDEALLLAERAGVPVMAGRDRLAAARELVREQDCNLILADDGLQHYRLARDLELLLIDGARGFGNGRCLPAGPLREPLARARRADLILMQQPWSAPPTSAMQVRLAPRRAVNLRDRRQTRALRQFVAEPVTAVAGIAHPERFFAMLEGHGLRIRRLAYPDHHPFTSADLRDWPPGPVLMTEKDAVKCRAFARPEHWAVEVVAEPDADFRRALEQCILPLERQAFDRAPAAR